MTRAEHTLEAGPGLLACQLGRRGLARLLVGGAEVAASLDRVQVMRPENALSVGHYSLVDRDCLFCPAAGQVGVGQAVTRGDRLRVPVSHGALSVGKRAPVQVDGVGVLARSQVRGRELVARTESIGMTRPADSLELGNRAFKDGDRNRGLLRRHEGVAEAAPRLDHLTVIGPQLVGQAVEY